MYKISIYGCAMFKKLVCQWVNIKDNNNTHTPPMVTVQHTFSGKLSLAV